MPWYYDLSKSHTNPFLRFARHIYKPLHFEKGYNFPLWVIFGGAIFGFGCARVMYLDIDGIFRKAKIATGDWEYWQSGHKHIGIIMHLASVIPICFLLPWQFLPIVRHAAMLFHRINGSILCVLLLLATASAFMIARRSMGGTLENQTLFGILGIYSIVSLVMAYVNIKRLQIDQHRAWMLRAWFVAAAVISQRIIMIPTYHIVTDMNDYYFPMACHTIDYVSTNTVGRSQMMQYAACRADPVNGWAAVKQDFGGGEWLLCDCRHRCHLFACRGN